jgi:hypothetical protein
MQYRVPASIFKGTAMSSLRNDNEMSGNYAADEPDEEPRDESNYARRDVRSRDIVDHAIAVQESRNTMSAVEYMKSHDVAADVIERVMLDPERRRGNNAK